MLQHVHLAVPSPHLYLPVCAFGIHFFTASPPPVGTGNGCLSRYVPFPVKQAMNKAYISGLYWAKRGYKLLDKWTTPGGGGAEKKKTAGKSRRARNRESRD